jgi:hypothetical protein
MFLPPYQVFSGRCVRSSILDHVLLGFMVGILLFPRVPIPPIARRHVSAYYRVFHHSCFRSFGKDDIDSSIDSKGFVVPDHPISVSRRVSSSGEMQLSGWGTSAQFPPSPAARNLPVFAPAWREPNLLGRLGAFSPRDHRAPCPTQPQAWR